MSVNSKMTAIADEIRELSGTTGTMGLDAMATTLNTENTNFAANLSAQDNLIAQIQTALEGKAGGSAEPVLQTKTVSPATSQQTVKPDSGYDGLSQVTVNAMPTATQATPSISVNSSGLITASSTQSAGYVSAGTKSATKQLTTQAAKTVTPSTSSQTAVASGRYTTGAITVAAIPSSYVQPSGTLSVTSNGTHDVKNYASVNVNVASGGSSSNSLPTVSSGFVQSSAEGSVTYSILNMDGSISTDGTDLTYFSTTKKYRHPLDTALLANTPIIVLTSGTITMPAAEGYTLATLASGTGYGVYQYVVSTGEPEEDEISGL